MKSKGWISGHCNTGHCTTDGGFPGCRGDYSFGRCMHACHTYPDSAGEVPTDESVSPP